MGGGNKPLWQKLSNILLKFIWLPLKNLKQYSLFRQKLSPKGAILIEFAFCLPVLIVLIYYIYDLNRLKRYYSQTEFAAQQMASMFQNISQNRDKKVLSLWTDLRQVSEMAALSIYQARSMYRNQSDYRLAFGHAPCYHIIYVKGLDNGKASCIWANERDMYFPGDAIYSSTEILSCLPVHFKKDVAPSEIYPSLTINPGEVKIIIVFSFVRNPTYTKSLNGKYVTHKEAFNFYLLNPKYTTYKGNYYFFPSVVIFTPRPGVFPEDYNVLREQ